jgi:hypothetical protein
MNWWQVKPMRMVQTNLREIDLPLDPKRYARELAKFGVNVALFNLGGIVANYATSLPFHFKNPRLAGRDNELISEVITQLHKHHIRFIGRFDFSKINESIAALHSDWLCVNVRGEYVNYNGQVSCCVNGAYQQECSFKILDEALGMFPLDGVFFNMFGYQTHDYSGNYHGPCQCENCQQRFQEFVAKTRTKDVDPGQASIPIIENPADPLYHIYQRFRSQTSRELLDKIRDYIRLTARSPETVLGSRKKKMDETINLLPGSVAVATWSDDGVDIFRSESNSGLKRSQPEFIYGASVNVRRVHGSFPGVVASNTAVHFIDFPYRHAAVSPALTLRRLAQAFIHGGWLDYYVIGRLEQQHDRACQNAVQELFHLHERAILPPFIEHSFSLPTLHLSDICVIEPAQDHMVRNMDEFRGVITLLSEQHWLFDIVTEKSLTVQNKVVGLPGKPLSKYQLVILPDLPEISLRLEEILVDFVENGGKLLLTGLCAAKTGKRMQQLCGIISCQLKPYIPGNYFSIEKSDRCLLDDELPGTQIKSPNSLMLKHVDWIPLDTEWLDCTPTKSANTYLRYVPVGMYGPPEKCYYTQKGNSPGLITQKSGKGMCTILPFKLGSQYYVFPTHALSGLFRAVLENVIRVERSVSIDAPACVEVCAYNKPDQPGLLFGLANLSGQNGRAIHDPLPIYNLSIHIPWKEGLKEPLNPSVQTLTQGQLTGMFEPDHSFVISLPHLDLLELISIAM